MLYQKKAPEILEQYNIRAFPTFVVIDAEEHEQLRKIGSGGINTVDGAIEWFTEVPGRIDAAVELHEEFKEDGANVELGLKVVEAYKENGQPASAVKVYETLIASLPEDDKRRLDFRFDIAETYKDGRMAHEAVAAYEQLVTDVADDEDRLVDAKLGLAEALRATATRATLQEIMVKVNEIHAEILPGLIEAKDERAIGPSLTQAGAKAREDAEAARKQVLELAELFSESDRILEIKVYAAFYAQRAGDTETARKEYEAVIAEGEEDDRWVQAAKRQLERIKPAESE